MSTPHDPSVTDPTSLTLIGSAQAREPEAWRRLVILYSPSIFHWAKRAGLGDEDSADITQEVWISVNANLDRFRKEPQTGTFRGWLWTITRNKTYDLFRRKDEALAASGGTSAQIALANIPEEEPADATDHAAPNMIEQALEFIRPDFEPQTWQAFWRMTVDGHSAREIAEDLKIAANAVHQARFRVVKRLRQELTALGIIDDPTFAGLMPAPA